MRRTLRDLHEISLCARRDTRRGSEGLFRYRYAVTATIRMGRRVRKSFKRLWQRQTMLHSARTLPRPRSENRRKPMVLTCPKTGSTIALRRS